MGSLVEDKKKKEEEQKKATQIKIYRDVDKNVDILKSRMQNCGDFILREFNIGEKADFKIVITYLDGMVDRNVIDERIMKPLMLLGRSAPPKFESIDHVYEFLKDSSITTADIKELDTLDGVIEEVLIGDAVVLFDECQKAIMISAKGWPNRGIQEPRIEAVTRGPSDGFTETIRMNTALIRRRIRDTRLKIKQDRVGKRSNTDIAIVYIEDIVNKSVLKEVEKRIKAIDIDAILESGYIEQLIEDDGNTFFPQTQVTQRPDEAVAAVYEGRVVIIVDNSPFVLIVPVTMNSLMQVAEDYYDRWMSVSILRILRYIAVFISIGLTGLYIAIISYHPDFLPVAFTLSIASSRASVPFPAFLEAIFMEFTIEVLREAGARLPGTIGQTIGIVGGVVIGQAAVSAGLVSPIMVIIVSLTAIASFAIPNYNLSIAIRSSKFMLIIFSAIFGFYGFAMGSILILINLAQLKSFGVPYLSPFAAVQTGDFKDSIIRAPLKWMRRRPSLVYQNKTRLRYKDRSDDHGDA